MAHLPLERNQGTRPHLLESGGSGIAGVNPPLTGNQWRFLVLLILSSHINFIDRGNLSAAAPVLSSDLSLSATNLGMLLSAFGWTYAFSLPIAGWLVDRYDVKWVFAAGFFIWSLATLGTGWIQTFHELLLLRLLLGMGEAVVYPSYSRMIVGSFS